MKLVFEVLIIQHNTCDRARVTAPNFVFFVHPGWWVFRKWTGVSRLETMLWSITVGDRVDVVVEVCSIGERGIKSCFVTERCESFHEKIHFRA